MNELNISHYQELKERLDNAMGQAVENFVQIGYLLRKVKEDESLLEGSGYGNYKEFAKAEYGLEETQVSRFISINERYGDGASLLPQYKGYGQSKLAEMLSLPAAVAEELPKEITRQEIRDIKAEIAEENKISDIEVAIERAEAPVDNIWKAFLQNWIQKNPEKFITIDSFNEYETLFRNCVLTARVPGEGKLMMTEADGYITLTNMRTGEKEKEQFEAVESIMDDISCAGNESPFTKENWEEITGEKYPEIAPAQKAPADKAEKPKTELCTTDSTEVSTKVAPDKAEKPIVETEKELDKEPEAEKELSEAINEPIEEPSVEKVEASADDVEESENEGQEAADELKSKREMALTFLRTLLPRLTDAYVRGDEEKMKEIADDLTEQLEVFR